MSGGLPMPLHERFYPGTRWGIGDPAPVRLHNLMVEILTEPTEKDGDMVCRVVTNLGTFMEVDVSWLK